VTPSEGVGGAAELPSGARPSRSLCAWALAAVIGGLLLTGGNGLLSYGERRTPSGIAALLVASVPLAVGPRVESPPIAAPALGSPDDSRIELTASTIAWSERDRCE
jgi:hypothetical protein